MTSDFDAASAEYDQKQYRVERARAVAEAIRHAVPFTGSERVLDFGCGTGLLGLSLVDSVGQIWLGDTSEGMLREVRRKIEAQHLTNAFAVNLDTSQERESYDVIVSLMVLHHIPDVRTQISKLAEWTVPGGWLCLCDLDEEDGSFHEHGSVPHNGFRRDFVRTCMNAGNVEPVEESTVYVVRKVVAGEEREYPVFMLVGRKRA